MLTRRPRLGQLLEIMTTSSTDFRERITGEITAFIQNQARAVSITAIERLVADLPGLRKRFAKIPAEAYPYLAHQLQFLSLVFEDLAVRDPAGEILGEAVFALLYFQRATDLIPEAIPDMGLSDDSMIVSIVLRRQEHAFKRSSHGHLLRWPEPRFDIDQLLSVISPLRVTSFCSSLAIRPPA